MPTATGTFPFTVRVADTFGQSDTQALSILVSTDNPPQIVPPSLPSGTVGVAYGPTTVQATGGMGTLTWSISAGSLPPGLTGLPSTGQSVTISGTPTSQGTFNFTVRVTDSLGQFDTQALSITINLPIPPRITTTSLPAGSIGQTYTQPVEATEGTRPMTWSVDRRDTATGPEFGSNDRRDFRNTDRAGGHIDVYRPSGRRSRTSGHASSLDPNQPSQPADYHDHHAPGRNSRASPTIQTLQATGGIGLLTWTLSGGSLPATAFPESGWCDFRHSYQYRNHEFHSEESQTH